MHNDLDRDLALKIKTTMAACLSLVTTINDNKYVAHITQQPVDITAELDEIIYFTLTANNVKKYRWQYKNSVGQWTNTTLNGYNTNSVRVVVTAARYGMLFRCVVTGLDNNDIYSDEVTIINPNE